MQTVSLKVKSNLELIEVDDLEPLQGELKKLTDENFNKLRKSILEKGFKLVLHVWQNGGVNYLIDGHQRAHVLKQLKKQGIDVPKIPCAIIEAENYSQAKETVLLAVSQYGKIDKDGFEEFISGEDFNLDDFDFPNIDDDFFDVDSDKKEQDDDSPYTSKIDAPIYEPTGEKPKISDLCNTDKYESLIENINKSDIPESEKEFLVYAAFRHNVFMYDKIAEYYSHSSKKVQELMEESALVIIDFDKAIEQGFVKLTENIAEVYKDEKKQ